MKFNSSWHRVPKHYELCQLLSILWFLAAPKKLPDDIFLFSLFINTSRITSGRIKKKAGKKCVYSPADLEVTLPEIRDSIAKKSNSQKVKYPKVHLTVSIK